MTRYEPTRAGIINMWDYRDEEFSFARGWLILRGPNGSGKTKALEVLFPFVLDGRIDPKRLNPFAAGDRTMKSNLLYRGADNAVGYVWLEFRHRDTRQAVTVGIGLHAQRHRDTPVRWHFVADGRVGEDFSLLTDDDRPMTRKQLAEEIGDANIHASATDYRAAIDTRLFGLGAERYEQLVTLILTLRRPQLAKNLDPVRLSDTLTDGLRPVDDDLINEAARSFDDMETVTRTLEGLVAADEATAAFLASYTTYLRTHARAAAGALTRRREATQAQRAATVAYEEAERAARDGQRAAENHREQAETAVAGLRGRIEQLRASNAYQAVEQMGDLDRLVRTCLQTANETRAELDRRQAAAARARSEAERAGAELADLSAAAARTAAELLDHAARAGIDWQAADAEAAGVVRRASARAAVRLENVRAVRAPDAEHRKAEQSRDLARIALDRATQALTDAEQAEQAADGAVASAVEAAGQALAAWSSRHSGLLPTHGWADLTEALGDALAQFGEPDAALPESTYNAGTAPAEHQVRDEQAALRARHTALVTERKAVTAERAAIAAERDDAPPRRPGRRGRAADRMDVAGAPLWRLVRFAPGVDDTRAAAIEAALEASGMLDAWVSPDGHAGLLAAPGYDGYLVPGTAVTGPNLTDVLEPEDDTPMPRGLVTAILASVALDGSLFSSAAVTGSDGRYSQGIIAGRHHKEHAEYIGATARAHRRAARITECDARIATLTAEIAGLDKRAQALADTLAAFGDARTDLPTTGQIAGAQREHNRAAGHLRSARHAAEQARVSFDESVAAVTVTERALRRAAADNVLTPESADRVEDATRRFEAAARDLEARYRERGRQADAVADARDRVEHAAAEEQAAAGTHRSAYRRHAEENAKLQALRESVGAEAQEVLARISAAESGLAAAQDEEKAARGAEMEAIRLASAASERVASGRAALRVALDEELTTARRLAPFAARELLDVLACPPGLRWPASEEEWTRGETPPAALAIHDAILTATRGMSATETSQKASTTRLTRALEELQAQLAAAGQDYHPAWDSPDGVIVVRIADEQGPLPAAAFANRISAARRDQHLLLSDSEQRILEDALLTRLAQQIHDRTVDARDLIRAMNREMRERRMSSGKKVGVSWQMSDALDAEQRAVVSLLDTESSRLAPDSLARMRAHFADRIKTERARHRDQPYRELLASVLDYRRWRQFSFRLVGPEGEEETLTRARHSRLSGGEQSVSLHLPLFAAAHATLNTARPDAPRLLALDEAFAGVDDTGRAELMSLAAQFDLDLFMTGYDLWATSAAVRAAAHYDLAHSPVQHTVSALLLVWDGSELIADETGTLTALLGSPGTRRAATSPHLLLAPQA
ncbi:TIGR02680 family protein [Frankia sp. CiP3]|uniref:TIGR02680 family protein n=1 Tax=Frankia sp. CiP3 TaxID=2880971 RepID=UPI001EF74941|nr:TIGR02680 family protein [Frankia sp. CiP3]